MAGCRQIPGRRKGQNTRNRVGPTHARPRLPEKQAPPPRRSALALQKSPVRDGGALHRGGRALHRDKCVLRRDECMPFAKAEPSAVTEERSTGAVERCAGMKKNEQKCLVQVAPKRAQPTTRHRLYRAHEIPCSVRRADSAKRTPHTLNAQIPQKDAPWAEHLWGAHYAKLHTHEKTNDQTETDAKPNHRDAAHPPQPA